LDSKVDVQIPGAGLWFLCSINRAGFAIIAASFLPAMAICYLLGDDRKGTELVIGGILALAFDLGYRLKTPTGHWFLPDGGGKVIYLPVWMWSIFWIIFGIWELS